MSESMRLADELDENWWRIKLDKIKESACMIESIADHLLEDHVELMQENRALLHIIDLLEESLEELLNEYHPKEHWTDEHIEFENKQGNMMAPVVRRAMDAIALSIRARGEK